MRKSTLKRWNEADKHSTNIEISYGRPHSANSNSSSSEYVEEHKSQNQFPSIVSPSTNSFLKFPFPHASHRTIQTN